MEIKMDTIILLLGDVVIGMAMRLLFGALVSSFTGIHIFIKGIPVLGIVAYFWFTSPFEPAVTLGFYLIDFYATSTPLIRHVVEKLTTVPREIKK
jgi:hypothetical protein